jgi:hypothetical protein
MAHESGWLIERHVNSQLLHFNGKFTDERGFTPKHDDAIRFAREDDASTVLAWLLSGNGRVAEHIWSDESSKQVPNICSQVTGR